MTVQTRRRGRPKGASRYKVGDAELLARVADRLLVEPTLPFTTAARHILAGQGTESQFRRLQRRWKAESSACFAAARDRAVQHRERQAIRPEISGNGVPGRPTVADAISSISNLIRKDTGLGHAMAAATKIAALGNTHPSEEMLHATQRVLAIYEGVRRATESPGVSRLMEQVMALQARIDQIATPTRLEQLARGMTQFNENMRQIFEPTHAEELVRSAMLVNHIGINGVLPQTDR